SIVLVVVGGAIGFTSSLGVWYLNVRQQRRAARKQMMLRVITLAYTLVLYVRNLLYAKAAGIQAVRELGEGPFPEIAAIASFTFSEVGPVVVLINEDLAALSARDTTGADAGPWMIQQAEKLVTHC